MNTKIACATISIALMLFGVATVQAQNPPANATNFPNAPVDYTTNATAFFPPRFVLTPTPVVKVALANLGGANYDPIAGTYTSGLLLDFNYKVGVSAGLTEGANGDVNGVPVGSAGTNVSTGSFALVAPGFDGPAGTDEVHTQILSLNLNDQNGNGIRAGSAAANGTPASFGEMESTTGNPANDFPAKSFFDIFATIDIPSLGTLTNVKPVNPTPLLVSNSLNSNSYNLTQAVNGDDSNLVPVYFLTVANGLQGIFLPGDSAGTLQLTNTHVVLPEPASVTLLVLGAVGLMAHRFWRARLMR